MLEKRCGPSGAFLGAIFGLLSVFLVPLPISWVDRNVLGSIFLILSGAAVGSLLGAVIEAISRRGNSRKGRAR